MGCHGVHSLGPRTRRRRDEALKDLLPSRLKSLSRSACWLFDSYQLRPAGRLRGDAIQSAPMHAKPHAATRRTPGAALLLLCADWRPRRTRSTRSCSRSANCVVAAFPWKRASARLDLLSDKQTRVTLRARARHAARSRGQAHATSTLVCTSPVIAEPRFGCDAGRLTGRGGPDRLASTCGVTADDEHRHGRDHLRWQRPEAGGHRRRRLDGRLDDKGWQVKGRTGTTTVRGAAQVRRAVVRAAEGHHRRRQGRGRRQRGRYRRGHAGGRHAESRCAWT